MNFTGFIISIIIAFAQTGRKTRKADSFGPAFLNIMHKYYFFVSVKFSSTVPSLRVIGLLETMVL